MMPFIIFGIFFVGGANWAMLYLYYTRVLVMKDKMLLMERRMDRIEKGLDRYGISFLFGAHET